MRIGEENYPALALMCHTPAVNGEATAIRLHSWPFNGHVPATHESLPKIVEAVVNVAFPWRQQSVIDTIKVVPANRELQSIQVLSYASEAM